MAKHPFEKEAEERIAKSLSVYGEEMATIHTGRATPALVEGIRVTYYGAPTPLKQVAVITIPQPNIIVIRPYEQSMVGEIQKALLKADLGFNVSADAKTVRVIVPAPSQERRRQLVRRAKEIAEGAKIAIRNIRRDIKKRIDTMKREGEISEDDAFRLIDRIQDIVKNNEEKVENLLEKKEREILD